MRSLLLALALVLSETPLSAHAQSSTGPNSSCKLSGDVFIVTNGGSNIKLGLVGIQAFSESSIKAHIAKRTSKVSADKALVNEAIQNLNQEIAVIKAAGTSDLTQVNGELSQLLDTLVAVGSAEYYFARLPNALATAKTDADGKFDLVVPCAKRIALVAKASRQVMGDTEDYYWMIWISPTSGGRVFLSNDNLLTVPNEQSVFSPN